MGSWLTVKEQMATTYARRLAESGYTTFVFDFSGFGESRGEPRQAEIPARKIRDIEAAAGLLETLAFVDPARIGCLAICASAQYALRALGRRCPDTVLRQRRRLVPRPGFGRAVLRKWTGRGDAPRSRAYRARPLRAYR
jgi:fermentation-respiration switch protein FrsA (DUF1100 family)